MIPLALPLIRQLQMGQFYFGDPSKGGSTFNSSPTVLWIFLSLFWSGRVGLCRWPYDFRRITSSAFPLSEF